MTSVNKNSWHYHLATEYGNFNNGKEESDFCSYSREVIKGFLMTLVAIGIGSAIGFLYLDLALWTYFCIHTGHLIEMNTPAFVALSATILIGGSIAWHELSNYFADRRYQKERLQALAEAKREWPEVVEAPPGFFKLLYTKFNNKVCIKLDFK